MNLAVAAPNATKRPMLTGSALVSSAALEAIRRLDGPANGIRFRPNEVNKIVRSSMSEAKCVEPALACFET
jgi:hypothetical protein